MLRSADGSDVAVCDLQPRPSPPSAYFSWLRNSSKWTTGIATSCRPFRRPALRFLRVGVTASSAAICSLLSCGTPPNQCIASLNALCPSPGPCSGLWPGFLDASPRVPSPATGAKSQPAQAYTAERRMHGAKRTLVDLLEQRIVTVRHPQRIDRLEHYLVCPLLLSIVVAACASPAPVSVST